MKKIIAGLLVMGVIVLFSSFSSAAENKTKFFGDLEMFMPANVADGGEADVKDTAQYLVDVIGYDSVSYKLETTAAVGARVGVLFPIDGFGDIGVSVGYLAGPKTQTTMTLKSTIVGDGGIKAETNITFTRVLCEYKKDIPVNENWSFKPGIGIGLAFGQSKEKITSATGSAAGTTGSAAKSWNGVTWEVSPAFTRRYSSVDLNLAIKYAGFPKLKENDNVSKIDWSTLGFSIGLGF